MKTNPITISRLLRKLRTAVGYHELGMTVQALTCLDSVSGKIGPFSLVIDVLRAEFLAVESRQVFPASALEIVACMLPVSASRAIKLVLAACFGPSETGRAGGIRAGTRSVTCSFGLKSARYPYPTF
jgi:hypothetical protein